MHRWYHWLSPAHHLLALHARWVVASVGAEIKAQSRDQQFVKEVCYSPIGKHEILEMDSKLKSGYKGKMRWFMNATFLLESLIRVDRVSLPVKEKCYEMLMDRYERILDGVRAGKFPGGRDNPDLLELEGNMEVSFLALESDRRAFF